MDLCPLCDLAVQKKLYFFVMKFFYGLLLLTGFAACSSKPDPGAPRPKLITTDSSLLNKETTNPYVNVDVSPMDMSYFPTDYPKMVGKKTMPVARVIYSRPHKQGRKIFGYLVKYGDPWRLGANEATEIEIFQPILIQGKTIPKGRYILYCIPQQNQWTIVFNSNLNSWGLNLDASKDLYRFNVPVQNKGQSVEYFSIVFQNTSSGADLVMAWDSTEARMSFQYGK
jgi:hypothetical protein